MSVQEANASDKITGRIKELADWRGTTLAEVRRLIRLAEPAIEEEWKWRGVPVWSRAGIVCTGESYQKVIKLTFPLGASLNDPDRLFNSSLEGNVRRAIDFYEGEAIPETAFIQLIQTAVAANIAARVAKKTKGKLPKVALQTGKLAPKRLAAKPVAPFVRQTFKGPR